MVSWILTTLARLPRSSQEADKDIQWDFAYLLSVLWTNLYLCLWEVSEKLSRFLFKSSSVAFPEGNFNLKCISKLHKNAREAREAQ